MTKISLQHGGKEYDDKFPDGIPCRVIVEMKGKDYFEGNNYFLR